MITLKEFCRYLDTLLQTTPIQDASCNGLQVEGKNQIKSFATAVSASLETIKKALQLKVDVLIVHHGLFWSGDNYALVGSKAEKISLLMQNQISLIAYHLPLDMHEHYGNNWKAAKDMGWKNLEPFGIYKGVPIGVKGKFKTCSRTQFQKELEEYYNHPATTALGGKEKITSAALISGGAYRSISDAAKEGMDCFITGNFDEPAWHQAYEEKINFFALGHSATERVGPIALGEHLQKHFKLKNQFIDIYNPF